MSKSLIDSNILVYVLDEQEKEKHLRILQWFHSLKNPEEFAILPQNLREFSFVFWKKKTGVKAEKVNQWIDLFMDSFVLLDESVDDIKMASTWQEEFGTDFWDSLIASAMKRHNITTIYTENIKDFVKFRGIKVVDPLK